MVLPFDEVGDGPAVVLLHAGIADRSMWREHLEPLAAAGHRVIAPDLPGFGHAPAPAAQSHWLDVIETLDAARAGRAVLVGSSFGAAVALRVAVVAPEKVAALALFGSPPELEEMISPQLEAVWEAEEAALERGDVDGAVKVCVDAWVRDDGIRDRVAAMQRRAFEIGLGAPDPAPYPDPVEDDPSLLASIRVPVLVAVGDLDLPDYPATAEWLEQTIPGARRVTVEGSGHLVPLEQPEAFRARLLEFLAEQ